MVPPVSFTDGLTDRNRHCPRFSPVYIYCLFWTFFNGPSLLNLWNVMTSEAKIYIILSKEWKINRYGPWIFHTFVRASQCGQDESAATPCGKAQWARPVGVCIVQWGCVPKGERTQEPQSFVKVPSRVSVVFFVNPAWVSRAPTPCGKGQCG